MSDDIKLLNDLYSVISVAECLNNEKKVNANNFTEYESDKRAIDTAKKSYEKLVDSIQR